MASKFSKRLKRLSKGLSPLIKIASMVGVPGAGAASSALDGLNAAQKRIKQAKADLGVTSARKKAILSGNSSEAVAAVAVSQNVVIEQSKGGISRWLIIGLVVVGIGFFAFKK